MAAGPEHGEENAGSMLWEVNEQLWSVWVDRVEEVRGQVYRLATEVRDHDNARSNLFAC